MIEQEEAITRILSTVRARPSRSVLLADALDRFASEDVVAWLSLPPFDNSAMDGYAVVARSCAVGGRLRVIGQQPAGLDRQLAVRAGEAVRIFTGAPLPSGADAVVMQEEVTTEGGDIVLQTCPEPGEFIRRRGGDIAEGQECLSAGERITPQAIALLAAQGLVEIRVGGEVHGAIVSTGDELSAAGATLRPGQLYEANSALLEALLRRVGANVESVTHCADRQADIEAAIRAGIRADVLIITGGVSVGARDLVKPALTAAGATLDLWRVNVKPGKPFLYGRAGDCAVFGLPGNPVSAFVTFLLFVRPALLRLMGAANDALGLREHAVTVTEAFENAGDRPHYVRGVLAGGKFTPIGRQESHALFGLARSNALLRVPPRTNFAAGQPASALTWD